MFQVIFDCRRFVSVMVSESLTGTIDCTSCPREVYPGVQGSPGSRLGFKNLYKGRSIYISRRFMVHG